jgi:phage repressor protein C with HTH and peptisase S24 domain
MRLRHAKWGLARVHGDSMLPTLKSGDRLLVRHGASIHVGDLVVARFPDGTLAVKRAAEPRTTVSGAQGWWLLSDNADAGTDSRHRGTIAQTDVVARVVCRLWPHPGPT